MLNPTLLFFLGLCFVLCDSSLWGGTSTNKEVDSHLCPDKAGTCPDKSTCCKLNSGKYGCCPLQDAVCCSDHVHCCPQGFTCDTSQGTCNSQHLVIDWLLPVAQPSPQPGTGLKQQIRKAQAGVGEVCPGAQVECPSGDTCCAMGTKGYGCCSLPQATCCADKQHCCPKGTKCEDKTKTCIKQSGSNQQGSTLWLNLVLGRRRENKVEVSAATALLTEVVCPGGQFSCATGQTCCADPQGDWQCCPQPEAVCCSDGLHCCPHGYTCDVAHLQCDPDPAVHTKDTALRFVPMTSNMPARRLENVHVEHACPDNVSSCPDDTTCCKMKNGYYGCCQYESAVCCSDMLHCCPRDMQCNPTSGECQNSRYTLQFGLPETSKVLKAPLTSDIDCPDKSTCPSDTTCCELPDKGFGCCPFPNAHCCVDQIHCCPKDQTCDEGKGECITSTHGQQAQPWGEKLPSTPAPTEYRTSQSDVICPGGKSQCPGQSTCCELGSNIYGCCNLPNAVCCADKQHCCPQGYKCDGKKGACYRKEDGATLAYLKHEKRTEEMLVQSAVLEQDSAVVCPDGHSQCDQGTTCCLLSTGVYGCCPIPNAVCCSDHIHCCPQGYTCNVQSQTCLQSSDPTDTQLPWTLVQTPILSGATEQKHLLGDVVCPDKKVQCHHDQTCCKLSSGDYGCCPLPAATCCSDGLHCCPNGDTCDLKTATCVQGVTESLTSTKLTAQDIVCPDQKSQCHHDQTCCKLAGGNYGCCPLPAATCCSDGLHCCPHGSTCDTTAGTCSNDDNMLTISWSNIQRHDALFTESLASTKLTAQDIVCPDQKSQCHHDQTCCQLAGGNYGCCPLPAATCCSDGLHCCPHGSTCDTTAGTCSSDNNMLTISWSNIQRHDALFTESLSSTKLTAQDIVCPDQKSQCHHDQTCCKLVGGNYGCCPLPAATCCSDGLHCCPHGSTCDTTAGTCTGTRNTLTVSWTSLERQNSLSSQAGEALVGAVVCPDKTECPWGTTCCASPTDKYACCSHKNATCCADKVHCCPESYTCSLKNPGQCEKAARQVKSIPWFTKVAARPVPDQEVASESLMSTEPTRNPPGCHCASGKTCCRVGKGYGCCPWPNAECCSDQKTCCPAGYVCAGRGMCSKK